MLPSNSMDVEHEIIPYCNGEQVALDFTDQLPSGFRFNPTDSELIVDYLKAKIESREIPKQCRLHEVNVYKYKPGELTERYRSHENEWYFLTLRDTKDRRGNQRYRTVIGKRGLWRITRRHKPVYDATRQIVGYKGTLAFIGNARKTMWLMHEYTTNAPNDHPSENGDKLNEWVLCKIYMEQTANGHGAEEVGSIMNPNEVTEEPNVTPDILLPKRRRVPDTCEIKVSNRPEQVDVQEANDHLDTHFQMAAPVEIPESSNEFKTNRMEFAHTLVNQGVFYDNDSSPYPIPMQPTTTFQGWGLIKAPSSYQDQFTSDAYNGYQISDCATSSVSVESPASSSAQLLDDGAYTTPTTEYGLNSIQPVQKECYHNMFSSTACDSDFLCLNGALNSSSMEPLVYGGYTTTPVLSGNSNEDGPTLLNVQIVGDQSTQDDADDDSHFPRSNGYEATISDHVEVEWSLRNLKIV